MKIFIKKEGSGTSYRNFYFSSKIFSLLTVFCGISISYGTLIFGHVIKIISVICCRYFTPFTFFASHLYLCVDSLGAPGHPSGKMPWGLEHRTEGSACSVGEAPEEAAPDTPPAEGSGRAGQQHCGQILAPGRCRHYLLGNNDRQLPTKER